MASLAPGINFTKTFQEVSVIKGRSFYFVEKEGYQCVKRSRFLVLPVEKLVGQPRLFSVS